MKSIWPIGIIAFFIISISSMVAFVVWSTRQRVDLVADDYYEQELQFQQRVDASARAANEGLKPAISFDAAAAQIVLQFATPAAVQSATGVVTLYRPSDAALDRSFDFAPDETGKQAIAAPLPPGLWRVKAEWHRNGQTYFAEDAIIVR